MSRAAEIVALQLGLIDEFYLPHPTMSPTLYASTPTSESGRERIVVPRSRMSEMADACVREHRQLGGASTAPMIVYGLKYGRTYRVQENMTPLVVERADAMDRTTAPVSDIEPPRSNGFAYFEDPVPGFAGSKLGYSAISWTCAVDRQPNLARIDAGDVDHLDHIGLSFLITVWADIARPEWNQTWRPPHRAALTPVTMRTAYAGDPVGRPWLPKLAEHANLNVPRARNPVRLALALWQLLGETRPAADGGRVEQADDEPVPRTLTRRARNTGAADPEVTTVVLRREARPVLHPGSGTPMTSRVWIEPYKARRWVGPRHDRRLVWRTIPAHWSNGDESLPVRKRTVVSELRR